MKTLRILCATVVAAALAVAATPATASAHASLISSDPKDGAVLAEAPAQVVLEFSEAVDANSTDVAVTDDSGTAIALPGDLKIDGVNLTVPIELPAAGDYTVAYRIVSVDGHPVEGTIGFTAESVPEPTASAQGSSAPSHAKTTAEATAAADEAGSDSIGWGTVLAVAGGVVVLVAAVVLFLALSRRRSSRPDQ